MNNFNKLFNMILTEEKIENKNKFKNLKLLKPLLLGKDKYSVLTPKYRFGIFERDGNLIGAIFQLIDETWFITSGQWPLKSLLFGDEYTEPMEDKIYIDFGEKWYVEGLNKIKNEIKKEYDKRVK